jgi:LacI family transcriptional regulator, galactose operon repressor
MEPRPTMRDVARAAGVSLKTVSRVVNDEPGVGPAAKARVRVAIERLGFRRNDLARSLRKGSSSATVGLVIEDLDNPFYAAVARSVERVARHHHHLIIVISSEEDPERERESVIALVRRRVDGLVIVPSARDHRYLLDELRMGIPMVFVDRPPRGIEADVILLDNEGGARRAVEHLLAQGHRRIAFVGDPPTVFTCQERLRGYRRALEDRGVVPGPDLVCLGAHDVDQAEAATRGLLALPDPPTAIFAQNNRSCIGALRAVRGSRPSRAVVGFDDFELADMLPVPATVIGHDPGLLGRLAAELLFARLAGDLRPPQRIVVPVQLVVRGSGEIG